MPIDFYSSDFQADDTFLPWLTHEAPITEKLRELKGDAQINVLANDWQKTSWWDRHVLEIHQDKIFCREIMMHSHGIPCWYARTVIPESCYASEPDFFNRLEHEPLTNLVYNESRVKRRILRHYSIDEDSIEWHWLPSGLTLKDKRLWVRFAEFLFKGSERFYLSEVLFKEAILF